MPQMLDTSPYEEVLKKWDAIYCCYLNLSSSNRQWIFRGHDSSRLHLQTTLERAIVRFGLEDKLPDRCDKEYEKKLYDLSRNVLRRGLPARKGRRRPISIEGALLRKFKRQCYLYTIDPPDDDSTMEWFALMRHYGAPTRLLDWTYSFFVALFFAMENAEGEAAIWALNTDWLRDRVRNLIPNKLRALDKDPHVGKATFIKVFLKEPQLAVYAINPYRRNERLSIQQGVFLCPGRIDVPFEDNLVPILNEADAKGQFFKFRINVDVPERREILKHLQRMNIFKAALFPGLEGFAQSLTTSLAFPDALASEPEWLKYV
jgi:hypothetical protein